MKDLNPDEQAVNDAKAMIRDREVRELVRGYDEPSLVGAFRIIVEGKSAEEQRELLMQVFPTAAILEAGKSVNQLSLPEAYGVVSPGNVAARGVKAQLDQA